MFAERSPEAVPRPGVRRSVVFGDRRTARPLAAHCRRTSGAGLSRAWGAHAHPGGGHHGRSWPAWTSSPASGGARRCLIWRLSALSLRPARLGARCRPRLRSPASNAGSILWPSGSTAGQAPRSGPATVPRRRTGAPEHPSRQSPDDRAWPRPLLGMSPRRSPTRPGPPTGVS